MPSQQKSFVKSICKTWVYQKLSIKNDLIKDVSWDEQTDNKCINLNDIECRVIMTLEGGWHCPFPVLTAGDVQRADEYIIFQVTWPCHMGNV